MLLEGTKEGKLAPMLIVLPSLITNNMQHEICRMLKHHCDNKPWVWHYCKTGIDNNSPCPLLQRCSLLRSFFGHRKVSGSAGECEAQLRPLQKSFWGCPVLVLQSLPQGLLEVFTLQLSPIFSSSAYNWFLFILFYMFFISKVYPPAKDGHTWIFL